MIAGRGREGGFALLVVLWSVVLLALLATRLTAAGRTEVKLAGNLEAAAVAEAAADGAVFEAAYRLHAAMPGWRADGTVRDVALPGARVTVRIEDESGKVNPNIASPQLLTAMLREVGADARTAESVATAIADWRFPGDAARQGSAKTPQYRAAGLDYGPPETPFVSLDEVGRVLGMSPDLARALRTHLTLFTDTDPDPFSADPIVLRALGDLAGRPVERPDPASRPPLRAVTIVADARADRGGRFIRRAVVRFGSSAREPVLTVLIWTRAGS